MNHRFDLYLLGWLLLGGGCFLCVPFLAALLFGFAAALQSLLDIQIRKGQHDAAADTAAKLISVVSEPSARAEALTRLARVERARGKIVPAIRVFSVD